MELPALCGDSWPARPRGGMDGTLFAEFCTSEPSPGGKPFYSRLSREPPEKCLQIALLRALEKKWRFSGVVSSFPIFEGCADVFAHEYGQKSLVIQPYLLEGVVTSWKLFWHWILVIQPYLLEGVVTSDGSSLFGAPSHSTLSSGGGCHFEEHHSPLCTMSFNPIFWRGLSLRLYYRIPSVHSHATPSLWSEWSLH